VKSIRLDLGDGAELGRYSLRDAETLFALVDAERERLRRWLPWVDGVRTAEDERAWLKAVLSSADLKEEGYGIWDRGELAGCVGMHLDLLNDGADIGYWLGRSFEGRGLVTRACRALIDRGFGELRLHRVTIHAAPDNARSRAVPERLGFTQEAVLRQAGKTAVGYVDLVVYSMLDQEWQARS